MNGVRSTGGAPVLLTWLTRSAAFRTLHQAERHVHFLGVWPVYEKEMYYKLRRGPHALMERLRRRGVTDVVLSRRRGTCP